MCNSIFPQKKNVGVVIAHGRWLLTRGINTWKFVYTNYGRFTAGQKSVETHDQDAGPWARF